MFRLAYRNFGSYESLVVNHSVKVGTAHNNPYTGVRWYELRNPSGIPTVFQQSTFFTRHELSLDGIHRAGQARQHGARL